MVKDVAHAGIIAGAFLATHPDAHEQPIVADWGHALPHGRQILPGESGMDGFYYAVLGKQAATSEASCRPVP